MSDSNFDGVLDPDAGWPDIPQASTQFVVLGGPGGPLNEQAKMLAARTKKLKESIDDFSGAAFGGQYRKLVVIISGTGYQGIITAERLVVESADFKTRVLRNINLAFNGANIGLNGLDTNSISASNWYYIFAIYNPTTDTTASLISLSMTAPTLPTGYTMAAILGAAYVTAGTTAFMPSEKKDFETSLGAGGIQGFVTILNGGSSPSMTAVSTVTGAPTISSSIQLASISISGNAAVYADNVSTLGSGFDSSAGPWIWAAQKQPGVVFYKAFSGSISIRVVGYKTPF